MNEDDDPALLLKLRDASDQNMSHAAEHEDEATDLAELADAGFAEKRVDGWRLTRDDYELLMKRGL